MLLWRLGGDRQPWSKTYANFAFFHSTHHTRVKSAQKCWPQAPSRQYTCHLLPLAGKGGDAKGGCHTNPPAHSLALFASSAVEKHPKRLQLYAGLAPADYNGKCFSSLPGVLFHMEPGTKWKQMLRTTSKSWHGAPIKTCLGSLLLFVFFGVFFLVSFCFSLYVIWTFFFFLAKTERCTATPSERRRASYAAAYGSHYAPGRLSGLERAPSQAAQAHFCDVPAAHFARGKREMHGMHVPTPI